MNYSNTTNPFDYCATEMIVLQCVKCKKEQKKRLSHKLSDIDIMNHFRGWIAINVNGNQTLCPKCNKKGK